jgi:hypothetical protein
MSECIGLCGVIKTTNQTLIIVIAARIRVLITHHVCEFAVDQLHDSAATTLRLVTRYYAVIVTISG